MVGFQIPTVYVVSEVYSNVETKEYESNIHSIFDSLEKAIECISELNQSNSSEHTSYYEQEMEVN